MNRTSAEPPSIRLERRAKAHVLVAFLGYALWVTLKHLLHRRGTGLTPARLPADNEIVCTLDSPGIADRAERLDTTRSAAALDLWLDNLGGSLVAVGNAPTALFRLLELIDQGAITAEQARTHPHRNVVTQALGVTDPENLKVETLSGEFRTGFQILLCSDGLTEEVDDASIGALLARKDLSAQECVDQLISAALDGGGSDNVSVILLRKM